MKLKVLAVLLGALIGSVAFGQKVSVQSFPSGGEAWLVQ